MGNHQGGQVETGKLCFGCEKRKEQVGQCRVCQQQYCNICIPKLNEITCGNCHFFVTGCPNSNCRSPAMKKIHTTLAVQFGLQTILRPTPTKNYNEVELKPVIRCQYCIVQCSTVVSCGHSVTAANHATKCIGCNKIECVVCLNPYKVVCGTCNVAKPIWWCLSCRTIPGTFLFTDWIVTVSKLDSKMSVLPESNGFLEKDEKKLQQILFQCRHCMNGKCGQCDTTVTRTDKLKCLNCEIRLCSTCYSQSGLGYCRSCMLKKGYIVCDCGKWITGDHHDCPCTICGNKTHTITVQNQCGNHQAWIQFCCAHQHPSFKNDSFGFFCDSCKTKQICKDWDHRYCCFYCGDYESCESCLSRHSQWKMGNRVQLSCSDCIEELQGHVMSSVPTVALVSMICMYLWNSPTTLPTTILSLSTQPAGHPSIASLPSDSTLSKSLVENPIIDVLGLYDMKID